MPIDFEIQQGLSYVFTNLPNLLHVYSGRLGVVVVDLCYFALFSLHKKKSRHKHAKWTPSDLTHWTLTLLSHLEMHDACKLLLPSFMRGRFYRVFKLDMREIKHLLGHQKCTLKS